MTGTKLAVGLVAAMLVVGGLVSLAPQPVVLISSPTNDSAQPTARPQSSAAVAALCAGFPAPVVARINQRFDPRKWVDVNVVEHYEMKWFAVNSVTGACAPIAIEEPLKPGLNSVSHAVGVVDDGDLLGQGLPVYVVAELENVPKECGCRVFATIRLPTSAAPLQPPQRENEGPPPRIA